MKENNKQYNNNKIEKRYAFNKNPKILFDLGKLTEEQYKNLKVLQIIQIIRGIKEISGVEMSYLLKETELFNYIEKTHNVILNLSEQELISTIAEVLDIKWNKFIRKEIR